MIETSLSQLGRYYRLGRGGAREHLETIKTERIIEIHQNESKTIQIDIKTFLVKISYCIVQKITFTIEFITTGKKLHRNESTKLKFEVFAFG